MSKQTKIQPPTIFIFTWNTNGLNLCESGVASESKLQKRENIQSRLLKGFKCVTPNFIEEFRILLEDNMEESGFGRRYPDILVFATQGEPKSNENFRDFLYTRMTDFKYKKIIFEEEDGINEPYKRIDGKDSTKGSLRQLVFVHDDFSDRIEVWREKFSIFGILSNNYATAGTKVFKCIKPPKDLDKKDQDLAPSSGGAIATYIKIRNYDLLAFVNVHLPDVVDTEGQFDRDGTKKGNEKCLNAIVEYLLDRDEIETPKLELNYIFLMGDLNFQIKAPLRIDGVNHKSSYDYIATHNNQSIEQISMKLYTQDEFYEMKKSKNPSTLQKMHEGINYPNINKNQLPAKANIKTDVGPLFLPTWKLQSIDISREKVSVSEQASLTEKAKFWYKNKAIESRYDKRVSNCINEMKNNNGNMIDCYDASAQNASWRDRILYMYRGTAKTNIACLKYDMFDVENITYSDHTAVIGLFTLLGDKEFEEEMSQQEIRYELGEHEKQLGKIRIELDKLEGKRRKMPSTDYKKDKIRLEKEADVIRSKITKIITKYPNFAYYYRGAIGEAPKPVRLLDTVTYYYPIADKIILPFHVDENGKAYYFKSLEFGKKAYVQYDRREGWNCYIIESYDVSKKQKISCPSEINELPSKLRITLPEYFTKEELPEYLPTSLYLNPLLSTIYYYPEKTIKDQIHYYTFRSDNDGNAYYFWKNKYYKFGKNKQTRCYEFINEKDITEGVTEINCNYGTDLPPLPINRLPDYFDKEDLEQYKTKPAEVVSPIVTKPQTTKLQLDTIFYYNDDVNMYSFPFHLDSKGKAYYILDPVEYNNIYISYNFNDKKWYCYRIDAPDDVSTKITVECPPEAKLPPKILNRLPTNYDINDLSEYITGKKYSSWYNISQYKPNIQNLNPLNLGFSQ